MKILTSKQIYQADQTTIKNQEITSFQLMERAGQALANRIQELIPKTKNIYIFCGTGNNGGDGMVVGRILIEWGFDVMIYVVEFGKKYSSDFKENYYWLNKNHSSRITSLQKENELPELFDNDVILDCIFGIGLNRNPEGFIKNIISKINESHAFKIAIDIPSGLFADKPVEDFNSILQSDLILTLQFPKPSFFLPENSKFINRFEVLNIGLDQEFISNVKPFATLLKIELIQKLYGLRNRFDHKGTFGHTVIVGGSYGKMGAIVLATKAAFRTGAGLVTSFIPRCGYDILQISIPEAMILTDKKDKIISKIELNFSPDAVAIGMGMGTEKETIETFINFISKYKKPIVIDADGLNCLSENRELLNFIPKNSILTPHPGELKRLIGPWKNDYDKIAKCKSFVRKHQVILVVKGAYTMIFEDDNIYINSTGNPGMGTAGSGDTLSGVLAGLLSQNYKPKAAVLFGVYLHGLAGDLAAENLGENSLIAGDIISFLSKAYKLIRKNNGAYNDIHR